MINDDLWVRNKINVSCRGGVLLRPIEITFALSGFNGQSRALPLQTTIILYGNVIHIFYTDKSSFTKLPQRMLF
ncbi:putative uncharacterized protein [Parabacteroides johnsonii CAG:246]|nr:putative uncharacterized protein [Parabacteroides johnsonii CAG:246]